MVHFLTMTYNRQAFSSHHNFRPNSNITRLQIVCLQTRRHELCSSSNQDMLKTYLDWSFLGMFVHVNQTLTYQITHWFAKAIF
uniref:Uncharacterized protein n=1 Tax=Rhizophora mucronata TaxID=61149 RepID=A0A2P2Q715_RHIMU